MRQSPTGRVLTDRKAEPFSLADTAGTVHRLEDFQDRWLLLVFHRHLF